MPVYSRQQLSGSSNGLPITVSATQASAAHVVHQVQSTSTSALECVWLDAVAHSTSDMIIFFQIETATATDSIRVFLDGRVGATGFLPVLEGLPLTGTDTRILMYSATGNSRVAAIHGHVNRIATG